MMLTTHLGRIGSGTVAVVAAGALSWSLTHLPPPVHGSPPHAAASPAPTVTTTRTVTRVVREPTRHGHRRGHSPIPPSVVGYIHPAPKTGTQPHGGKPGPRPSSPGTRAPSPHPSTTPPHPHPSPSPTPSPVPTRTPQPHRPCVDALRLITVCLMPLTPGGS